MSSASPATVAAMSGNRALPPVLGRLLSGTFWLALRVPLQVVFSLWTTRLVLQAIGPEENGAYSLRLGVRLLPVPASSSAPARRLQRQISDAWTRGDREGVDRAIACGMNFYAAMALVQVAALLAVAYVALPHSKLQPESYPLVIKLLWLQAITAPCFGFSIVVTSVLQAARRYDFVPRFEVLIVILRFAVLVVGLSRGYDFFWVIVAQTVVQIGLGLGPALWVMVRELGHAPHFRGARWADYKVAGAYQLLRGADPDQRGAGRQARHDDPRLHARPRRGRVGRVGVQRGEQAVRAAPPDRLDAGLHGDAGGGQPGGGARRARAGAGQVRRHAAAHRRAAAGGPAGLDLRRPVPLAVDRRPAGLRRRRARPR